MKILLPVALSFALGTVPLVTGVRAQTPPANCLAANTPGEYIRLSSESFPQPSDASLSRVAGPDCRPNATPHATRITGPETVLTTTLTAPREAQKAYEQAQRFLTGREPDYVQAARQLERAVMTYPSFALAWDQLGVVRNRLGDKERAQAAFESATHADPSYLIPYLRLAAMAVLNNRMEDALRHSDEVLRHKPAFREAHDYRAVACHTLGRPECAAQSARAVLNTGPDYLYPRLHLILGDVLASQGDFRSAAAEYTRLMELVPDSPAALAAGTLIANWKAQGIIH